MKIACFLQTQQYRNKKSYFEAIEGIKTLDIDILLFPEFSYIPLKEGNTIQECFKKTDCLNDTELNKLYDIVLEVSKGIGKAIVVANQDSHTNPFILSIYANANANEGEGETKVAHYIKFTNAETSLINVNNTDFISNVSLPTIKYKDKKIGLTICADNNYKLFPACYNNIDIILNSTGGNVNHKKWSAHNKARSIENNSYVFVTMGKDGSQRNTNRTYAFDKDGNEITSEMINDHVFVYDVKPVNKSNTPDFDEEMNNFLSRDNATIRNQYNVDINKIKLSYNKISSSKNIFYDSVWNVYYLVFNSYDIFNVKLVEEYLLEVKGFNNNNCHCIIVNDWINEIIPQKELIQLPSIIASLAIENFVCVILSSKDNNVCIQCGNRSKTSLKKRDRFPTKNYYPIDLDFVGLSFLGSLDRDSIENVRYLIESL